MQIQDMFQADINRDINGVIKVAQNDEVSIEQELREYIITRELRGHFATFFNNYEKALDNPTDKIGVWISGFFGSGKSHFLKILSYLLANEVVCGKPAIEYFRGKFDDPLMFAALERFAKTETETILFNIDSKGPLEKDKTAILRIFYKVFYEHCGYYGGDLKLTAFEKFLKKSGKEQAFKVEYLRVHGDSWEDSRESYTFFEDDIVAVLQSALGMSEANARNWFNSKENTDMDIDSLVREINEYVQAKDKDFRLLFMIDEVGQYIGADSDLMLNLQTIVEQLGAKCMGKVWVMVTSQEAIDSVTKITGNDFSKIQGRFATRVSLSSSSVDEVIKKRVLAKKENAQNLLSMVYSKNSAVLKNLFTFNNQVLDIKGYAGETDFIETYPFVSYQFVLMQNVLVQIRQHSNAGKHLAGGERSMLSGFQEAAQAIQEKDENALIAFYQFYDTLRTFLDSTIRRVIDRCETAALNHDGIEPADVGVLKLLYLIRYVSDNIKPNIDNIATLMVDDMRADKIELRKLAAESLERLIKQNYAARNGDAYTFLTDDEQDIARDIRNTPVDSAMIVQSIAQTIFDDIYPNKRFRCGKVDFPFDQMVDETVYGMPTGGVKLRIVSVASDIYKSGEQTFIMKSQLDKEAIVVLSDEFPYFEELESAMKIRKYVKQRNVSQLPEVIQEIIRARQQQATAYESRAREFLEKSIIKAAYYSAGQRVDPRGSSAKDKLDYALTCLIESVYSKMNYIKRNLDSDAEIMEILNVGSGQQRFFEPNEEAAHEVMQYIELQKLKHLPTSMGDIQRRFGDIPYGWREIDIAGVVAALCAQQKIKVQYGGGTVPNDSQRMPDYLRRRSEIDKTLIAERETLQPGKIREVRTFLQEYLNKMDVPADEDGLAIFAATSFESMVVQYKVLLERYTEGSYPGRETVEKGLTLLRGVLAQKTDNTALFGHLLAKRDELLAMSEEMAPVETFFATQRRIFDDAAKLVLKAEKEKIYFDKQHALTAALQTINAILADPKPYARMIELPQLMETHRQEYGKLLAEKKAEVKSVIEDALALIHTKLHANPKLGSIGQSFDAEMTKQKQACEQADSVTDLDALIARVNAAAKRESAALTAKAAEMNEAYGVKIKEVEIKFAFPKRELKSEEDIDRYGEDVRRILKDLKKDCDGLQLE